MPGSITAVVSCGIRLRSRSLRRSLSRVSDRRQPPSVTRAAAAPFLPPAALVPTADEDFFFPMALRRWWRCQRRRQRKCERKSQHAARIARAQGSNGQMNCCGKRHTTISPRIITAKTTHAGRPSRRPNANGRSGRTRVSTKTNRRSHDVHYARRSRKRRNHPHATRDRSIQSQEVGPTLRQVKSSLAQQTLEVIDRQH